MLAGHRGQGADDLCLHRPARCCSAPGWKELDHPETLFPQDPVLAQAARAGGRGMLCRRQDETFCLAYPWDPRRPFPLTPAFCLARVKLLRGQPHVIFRFRPEGVPIPPAEEE